MLQDNVEQSLRRFLVQAKRQAYASDSEAQATNEPGGKERCIVDGNFEYRDRYFGTVREAGQEIVWCSGVPIWSMVYRGGLKGDDESWSTPTFDFLQESLRRVSMEAPFRGPRSYEQGPWRYEFEFDGGIWQFAGREIITHRGVVRCFHEVFGGDLQLRTEKARLLRERYGRATTNGSA